MHVEAAVVVGGDFAASGHDRAALTGITPASGDIEIRRTG